jgi:hypothetical protein
VAPRSGDSGPSLAPRRLQLGSPFLASSSNGRCTPIRQSNCRRCRQRIHKTTG